MCLYTKFIDNPKYKPNEKNGGQPPPVLDNRTNVVPIPCGKCIECIKQKGRDWQVRLLEDIKHMKNAYFITLTFSDQSIAKLSEKTEITGYPLDNYIATRATRLFLERWRKTHKKSLRHWLITELGHQNTENIHMHGLLWFENKDDILKLDQHWQYGYTWKGIPIYEKNKIIGYQNYVNDRTIGYITKYVTKRDHLHQYYNPIILCTAGIGKQYMLGTNCYRNRFKLENTNETYKTDTGYEIILPKYYKRHLYTDSQLEELWMQKLDKNERYILGQKTTTDEDYLNLINTARIKNKRLKYGSQRIDYTIKENEKKAREKLQKQRKKQGKIKTEINKEIQNTKIQKYTPSARS